MRGRTIELVAISLAAVSALAAATSTIFSAYQIHQSKEAINAVFISNLQSREITICEEVIGDIEEFMSASRFLMDRNQEISQINDDGTKTEIIRGVERKFPFDERDKHWLRLLRDEARVAWGESIQNLRRTLQVAKIYSTETTAKKIAEISGELALKTPLGKYPRALPDAFFDPIPARCRDIMLGRHKGLL